jgi:dipeptidyl aminopeptidase/acylaminoacyl peptidase
VRCRRISYGSDGLRVTGFIVEPTTAGRHPVVIFNRGGTQDFGAIRTADLVEFAGWALDGYVVVASQYRGNDGGEGVEEWGGAEVNDIVHLATLARALPSVDPQRVYMLGFSRGGMMTYLALKSGVQVRAAATVGGPSDLAVSLTHRGDMEEVYRALIPDYARDRDAQLRARSAVHWPDAINAPLLLLHGGADWRVWPGNALALATTLQTLDHPYGLVVYAGDDHPLTRNWPDARARIRDWFRSH